MLEVIWNIFWIFYRHSVEKSRWQRHLDTANFSAVWHWVCKPAYLVPVPSQDKLGRVVARWASGVKMGGWWRTFGCGSLISPDGVAPSHIVGVSASVIFPCIIKSRRRFLLAPAYPVTTGSPRKRAVKWFVCVAIVYSLVLFLWLSV